MKTIKFFFWKITHWKEYQERKFKMLAILTEKMDTQEKFRIELNNFVKKHKKVPPEYAMTYIAMMKINKPWYEDKEIIKNIKKTTKNIVRNEILNAKK